MALNGYARGETRQRGYKDGREWLIAEEGRRGPDRLFSLFSAPILQCASEPRSMTTKMARIHERSQSPAAPAPTQKRLKTAHIPSADAHLADVPRVPVPLAPPDPDPADAFADGLLSPESVARLHTAYTQSQPWKHCVLDTLVKDELLERVKDECLSQLSFTQKETDIYKVKQTGDLASLSYLPPAELALLPSLLALRDALYSPAFLAFLRGVTGCGPLSLSRRDMSVNSYTRGCHLLNHDDVIGSRRVSYILYMPRPRAWRPEWGGALELYPPVPVDGGGVGVGGGGVGGGSGGGGGGECEPAPAPSVRIPPAWGQFVFFEVQPGRSFHAVEEVVVGQGKAGRARVSVSGWFHAAQPGEPGYAEPIATLPRSTREQLVGARPPPAEARSANPPPPAQPHAQMHPPPPTTSTTASAFTAYADSDTPPTALPHTPLPPAHVSFLAEFLNPVYLQPRTLAALAERFAAESSLELHTFLAAGLAARLEAGLRSADDADGLGGGGGSGKRGVPAHGAGTHGAWAVKGPPHKWRYCTLRPHAFGPPEEPAGLVGVGEGGGEGGRADELMRSLQDELYPSNAFRAWLALVSRLLPLRCAAEARRFRRGLDYTLAGAEGAEPRLDVVLGLTPEGGHEEDAGGGREGRGERGRKASGIGGHAHPVASGRSGFGNGHASGSGSNGNGNGNGNGHAHASGSGGGLNGHVKPAGHKKRRSSKWATGEWGGWEVSLSPFLCPFQFISARPRCLL
ncbi:hypothetical protein HWV62_1276 [Athelia sp. TMB]|nr:hypothetical protein HWV62_1276 [Athelia sp. TMB]